MSTRVISSLLLFAMFLTLLTGCGVQQEAEPTNQPTSTAAPVSKPESTTTPEPSAPTVTESPNAETAAENASESIEPLDEESQGEESPVNEPENNETPIEEPIEESIQTVAQETENDELDEIQKNSIAWLNYLAVLSQEINSSKNSRMFLEEAYDSLINNTNPENVNELTESHMSSLLDIIEKYRMIAVKRDRLQYIYDQNKAKAMKEAMPNPVALLSAASSFNFKRLAASVIYMAVDSYSSYKSFNAELDLQYMKDGWELDDEEAANLHDSRKRAFMFMLEIVREDKLPGELALNEASVDSFVECQNNTNNYEKIQFLEAEKDTYEAFGLYWLELAGCYFESGEYEKCLDAISTYEDLQTGIFRKDYYLAQALPNVIVAAAEVYKDDEYIPVAERYLQLLEKNTERNEWSLRYFAAQMYVDLYARTNDESYLKKAYDLTLNNVTELIKEQRNQNDAYLAEVKEVPLPDTDIKSLKGDEKKAAKAEVDRIKEYNEALHEQRKTELAPVYEPLIINLDLLFGLADELKIDNAAKTRIDGILRGNGKIAFLSEELDNKYTFKTSVIKPTMTFDKDTITIPANYLTTGSVVKVIVSEAGKKAAYDDWVVKKVDRTSDSISDFIVTYTSKSAGKQTWSADSIVNVEITDTTGAEAVVLNVQFKVSKYKHFPVIPDTVEFEQVK